MEVVSIAKVTEQVLEESKLSRDNLNILYSFVCKKVNPAIKDIHFHDVFENADNLGLPEFETVARARRKIVKERPELQGSKKATEGRFKKYKEVLDYVTD